MMYQAPLAESNYILRCLISQANGNRINGLGEMTVTLAKALSEIRALRGHSLRVVEEATGISNAYLSQLERGDAQKPSPDKLEALARFYEVPYTDLMRAAGYLQRTEKTDGTGKEHTSA